MSFRDALSLLRKEDARKTATILLQEYTRRGRPGDHLPAELVHCFAKAVLGGQDSFRLTRCGGRWILDNGLAEQDVTPHLESPFKATYVLRMEKANSRAYIVDLESPLSA